MMSGALILLAGAITRGVLPEVQAAGWIQNGSLVIGYFLLAYGFFLSHRARRDAIRRAAQKRDESYEREAQSVLTPHDPPQDDPDN